MAEAAKEKSRLLLFAHFIFPKNEFIFSNKTYEEYQINIFLLKKLAIVVILITGIVCLLYLSFDNIFKM